MLKKAFVALALSGASVASSFAASIVVPNGSTVLTSWSFEAVTTTNTGTTATAGTADIGVKATGSAATALHASASTVFSNPAGNGSAKSFSSNNWGIGDYYQFSLSTVGFSNIFVNFGQMGSNTGPGNFKLAYSTDGTTFTDFQSYSVVNANWAAATFNGTTGLLSFDLSAVAALNNAASVTFRLIDTNTVAVTGGTVATTGTGRVDDFTVSSGPVSFASSVPEPSSLLALAGGVGILTGFRRMRRTRQA